MAGRAEPTPSGLIVHFQDVTQVREGDLARRQSEERYRAIVESITKPGAEINDYQPTPQDLVRAQEADLVFRGGVERP